MKTPFLCIQGVDVNGCNGDVDRGRGDDRDDHSGDATVDSAADQRRDIVCNATEGGGHDGHAAVTADALAADPDHTDAGRPGQNLRLAGGGGGGEHGHQDPMRESTADADVDAAVLMPHTACFDTGNNRQLQDMTVSISADSGTTAAAVGTVQLSKNI